MGWASEKVTIVFIIEDNNLSILTEKKVKIGKLVLLNLLNNLII